MTHQFASKFEKKKKETRRKKTYLKQLYLGEAADSCVTKNKGRRKGKLRYFSG
jgi:hypothetical protein